MDLRIPSVARDPIEIFVATSCKPSGNMLILPLSKELRIEKLNLERYTPSPPTLNGQGIHVMFPASLLARENKKEQTLTLTSGIYSQDSGAKQGTMRIMRNNEMVGQLCRIQAFTKPLL